MLPRDASRLRKEQTHPAGEDGEPRQTIRITADFAKHTLQNARKFDFSCIFYLFFLHISIKNTTFAADLENNLKNNKTMETKFNTYEAAHKFYTAILDITYGVANFRKDLAIEQVVELVAETTQKDFDKDLVEDYVYGLISYDEFRKAIYEKYVED